MWINWLGKQMLSVLRKIFEKIMYLVGSILTQILLISHIVYKIEDTLIHKLERIYN